MIRKSTAEIKKENAAKLTSLETALSELKTQQYDTEIEKFIVEAFEQNYELMALEFGTYIAPDSRESALKQVLLYWRKMKHVATTITETEIKLSLPNQRTSNNTIFTIEGVVDIIRDNDKTIMYDIKTHDADHVNSNKELYQRQLNVYAHIWQTLRKQNLDKTCVIATAFPASVKEAVAHADDLKIERELERWNPEIEIPFDQSQVESTIAAFTQTVEAIEAGVFSPPPMHHLQERVVGTNTIFATRVCRNCDARFSCDAYRTYAQGVQYRNISDIFSFYNDYGSDIDQAEWLNNNLTATTTPNFDDLI